MRLAAVRRIGAPAIVLALPLAAVAWAWPEELQPWRSLAIVSAWAGSGLLVAGLLLMVREPRLARLLGDLGWMYRWHHRSGAVAYLLLLIHPLALGQNGWAESPRIAWQTLAPWTQSWPVWLGWASLLLLMLGLATTFAWRLSYRRWRGFHYLLALGVVLGLAHVYVLLGDPGPLLAAIVLCVLAFAWRLLVSDVGLGAYPFRVVRVERKAARTIEATLAPCATALQVSPGQFVLAAFGDGPHYRGCGEAHPFTVSGMSADGCLRIAVKALGPCTRRIQELEPDVLLRVQGPFGSFLADSGGLPQLWVAGGVGITPFVAALRNRPPTHPTTLIYLYRRDEEAAFLDELRALAVADPCFELRSQACGEELPALDQLLGTVSCLAERQVHVCGPSGLVEALRESLRRRLGLPAASIHFESFDFR
jgi:predicted ferric reductase